MIENNMIPSSLFFDLYVNHKVKINTYIDFLDLAYEKSMQYFDETRKKVYEIKNHRNLVLYTLMYNISSSLNSYIKNIFLEINSIARALLIRNIIESIIIYEWLFCMKLDKHFVEGFYYHHIFQEKMFMECYFVEAKKEKINDSFQNEYQKVVSMIKNIYKFVDENKTIEIFSKRMGWSYGLIRKNGYSTMSTLVKGSKLFILKQIYFEYKLSDIVHFADFSFEISQIQEKELITQCIDILKKIEKKTNINIRKISIPELRKNFTTSIFEKYKYKYTDVVHILGKEKWYLSKVRKIIEKDELKNEYDFKTRFELESRLYAGGYTQVYAENIFVFTFLTDMLSQYGTQKQKVLAKYLIPLMKDIQSDFAFGFHNELKLKYRYLLEYLILVFLNKSTDKNYEAFTEKIFESMYDKTTSAFIKSLYRESCNYIHPNVYGYFGFFSRDIKSTLEYVQSLELIVDSFVKKFLSSFPFSDKFYYDFAYEYLSLRDEYLRVKSIFSKFELIV